MSAPKVLLETEPRVAAPIGGAPERAWKAVGWFGLLLALIGLGDVVLTWIPFGLGSPEWEFATISTSFSSLPLVSMGLAALLGAALASGNRALIIGLTAFLLALALLVLGALGIFLTDVPIALRSTPAAVSVGIKKAIVKTCMLGIGFALAYGIGAFMGFAHLRTTRGGYHGG